MIPDPHLPGCPQGDTSQLCPTMGSRPHQPHTLGHHTLQVDDVGVVELRHDAGFAQEVPSLLLRVACFQCLDGHRNLPLPWQLQAAVAHLSGFPCKAREDEGMRRSSASFIDPPAPRITQSAGTLTECCSPSELLGFLRITASEDRKDCPSPASSATSGNWAEISATTSLWCLLLKAMGQEQ